MGFKKGDVVQLKSGGPKMTVTGVVGEDFPEEMFAAVGYTAGDVTVSYFVGDKLEKGTFGKDSLVLAE